MDILARSPHIHHVYKKTPQRDLQLTYVKADNHKFDKAPLYFVIPGGGWYVEERLGMLNYARVSVNALLEAGFAVVTTDYRVTTEGVFLKDIVADCFDAHPRLLRRPLHRPWHRSDEPHHRPDRRGRHAV